MLFSFGPLGIGSPPRKGPWLYSIAARLCPAAVGATVYTASEMAGGYAMQALIFGLAPSLLTGLGVCLMLSTLVIMFAVPVDEPETFKNVALTTAADTA